MARQSVSYAIEVPRQHTGGKVTWRPAYMPGTIRPLGCATADDASEAIRRLLADGVSVVRAVRDGVPALIGSANGDGTATIWGSSGPTQYRIEVF